MTNFLRTLLLFSFIACGQTLEPTNSAKETRPNWKTLDGKYYSIQYPPDWELNQSGQLGTIFALLSPLEAVPDNFRENVNFIIQDLTGSNLDLNKYVELSEEGIKILITNPILIESERVNAGSDEYHRMVYTGDQGIFQLTFYTIFWVKGDFAYVLTLTCEQDKFIDFLDVGEAILNSFKFKQ